MDNLDGTHQIDKEATKKKVTLLDIFVLSYEIFIWIHEDWSCKDVMYLVVFLSALGS